MDRLWMGLFALCAMLGLMGGFALLLWGGERMIDWYQRWTGRWE